MNIHLICIIDGRVACDVHPLVAAGVSWTGAEGDIQGRVRPEPIAGLGWIVRVACRYIEWARKRCASGVGHVKRG